MSGTNYIKKVAIVGVSAHLAPEDNLLKLTPCQVNGSVGKHIVSALQRAGRHEITALTRGSGAGAPAGVRIASVSYEDKESLVAALQGQDALVITLSTRAAQGTQDKLLEAAAAAGVSFILPNEWGIEAAQGGLGDDALLGPAARDARRRVEDLGRSAWIAVTTGFWFAHSLATADAYGFDLARRSVTFFDDGTARINTIVSLPPLPHPPPLPPPRGVDAAAGVSTCEAVVSDGGASLTLGGRATDLGEDRRGGGEAPVAPDRGGGGRPAGALGVQEQDRVRLVVADEPEGHVPAGAPGVGDAGVGLGGQVRARRRALRGGEGAALLRRPLGLRAGAVHEDVL
ncbi:putative isoflavone reductase family protein [Rosellinia necatrix]|uniref:Putative isoflavone reductase family protein n=1 Tax=Rosellinia necatrix TaxID=77044 RepID=A0A1W2TIC3_ROSNE|nr:putative isoflavone reductase family protein [Rosellinia necatrix]